MFDLVCAFGLFHPVWGFDLFFLWFVFSFFFFARFFFLIPPPPGFVDGRVLLACGADLLQSMLLPGVWAPEDLEVILGRFGVVCLERSDQANLDKLLAETELFRRHRDHIYVVPQPIYNNVSSTIVRGLVKSHQSIRYLVPPSVERYIKEHSLYLESSL
jgi:nicotinic acid mononucleotide adenylyltransferase